jgi:hypothetical protein
LSKAKNTLADMNALNFGNLRTTFHGAAILGLPIDHGDSVYVVLDIVGAWTHPTKCLVE